MTVLTFAVGVAALAVALARWLRVAQREHYIPGSCWVTARRWVAVGLGPNAAAPIAAVALAVVALVAHGGVRAVAGIAAAVVAAAFPVGMTVLGHEVRLTLTRRAVRLAAVAVALAAVVAAACALLGRWSLGPALAAVLAVPLTDAALAVTRPWEARSAARFQAAATKRLRDVAPLVVAVTGSYGKTSTKNHIRDLAAGSLQVVASPASFNNQGGLSRTMNEHLVDGTDLLVAEMGMYGPGEIRALCSWVRPQIGVITAIGPMHLERVGSMAGIAAAKAEILETASTGVLWVDEPLLADLADRLSPAGHPPSGDLTGGAGPLPLGRPSGEGGAPRIWRAGTHGSPALAGHADVVSVEATGDGWLVRHDGAEVGTLPAGAAVHPGNVACAVAAVLAAGVPASALAGRLAGLQPPPHRAVAGTTDAGIVVIDDTYNANPAGAAAAVQRLAATVTGRRVVVTPGLVELGDAQAAANEALGRQVAESGATLVIVGRTNRAALLRGARSADGGVRGDVLTVGRRPEAREWVRSHLGAGDGVLWENDLPDTYP